MLCRAALPSECLTSECLSAPPQAPLQPARLFGALRAAALLCGSALSCCVAACGVALLFFLLVTRTLAPAAAHFQRDLYFDYTAPDVVAVASFLFTGAAASEPPFVKARRRQHILLFHLCAALVVQICHQAPFHEAREHAEAAEGGVPACSLHHRHKCVLCVNLR